MSTTDMKTENLHLSKDDLDTLNELVELSIDAEKGFREAATGVESTQLQTLLRSHSAERKIIADELRSHVMRNGSDSTHSGTLKGTLHRFWMEVRELVSTNNDLAIIAECDRGESVLKEEFISAIDSIADPNTQILLRNQLKRIQETSGILTRTRERLEKD